ncbi:hypothetical protein Tco_0694827 [Tanacetum coccineum]
MGGVTNHYVQQICYFTHGMEVLMCVWNLTGSSPLTQTGMADFVSGCAVIDAAQRKRVKYMAKCAAIGYGFLLFSFSSLGELEDARLHSRKEVDIGLDGGCDKSLRPADMLLYPWDEGGRGYIVEADPKILQAQDNGARLLNYNLIGAVSLLLREWGPDSISASL